MVNRNAGAGTLEITVTTDSKNTIPEFNSSGSGDSNGHQMIFRGEGRGEGAGSGSGKEVKKIIIQNPDGTTQVLTGDEATACAGEGLRVSVLVVRDRPRENVDLYDGLCEELGIHTAADLDPGCRMHAVAGTACDGRGRAKSRNDVTCRRNCFVAGWPSTKSRRS